MPRRLGKNGRLLIAVVCGVFALAMLPLVSLFKLPESDASGMRKLQSWAEVPTNQQEIRTAAGELVAEHEKQRESHFSIEVPPDKWPRVINRIPTPVGPWDVVVVVDPTPSLSHLSLVSPGTHYSVLLRVGTSTNLPPNKGERTLAPGIHACFSNEYYRREMLIAH